MHCPAGSRDEQCDTSRTYGVETKLAAERAHYGRQPGSALLGADSAKTSFIASELFLCYSQDLAFCAMVTLERAFQAPRGSTHRSSLLEHLQGQKLDHWAENPHSTERHVWSIARAGGWLLVASHAAEPLLLDEKLMK